MKIKILSIQTMLAVMLSWTMIACDDKEDIPGASYQPGAWFYGKGSVTTDGKFVIDKFNNIFKGFYSFYFYPEREVDTFALPEIRLMGKVVNYDREVNLVAGDGSTAVEGVHFEIVDKVLPANAISFVPKVLLIKKDLGKEEKVVKFILEPSDEFPARILGDTISDDNTFLISSHYELKFSNLIAEPPYWYQFNGNFGVWSQVKYEFMLEILGKYWGVEPVTPADMNDVFNDVLRMRYELAQWEKANGGKKMKDENNNNVSF